VAFVPSTSIAYVLAALRRDSTPAVTNAAAAAVEDWRDVDRHARRHDVVWWVVRALPATGVPEDVRAGLLKAAQETVIESLVGARQLAELLRLLEHGGVRAVAYKGPALAADVHGDVGARHFDDLDVLIARGDRQRATAVLRDAGYVPPAGFTLREERFYSRWEGVAHFTRADDLPLELHWRCQATRYGGPSDPAAVLDEARWCPLGGGRVRVPSAEDLGVLLALHGAKHAWRLLLWVADFGAAVSRGGFDWDRFMRRASAWRVRRAAHYALLVAHDLNGIVAPPSLMNAARDDMQTARLARAVVARHLGDPAAADVGGDSEVRYDLQWLDGARARLRYLTLAAVLPTPRDREVARFPDALLPLAYPVRAWRLLTHMRERRL
jgi:hypothetical protein